MSNLAQAPTVFFQTNGLGLWVVYVPSVGSRSFWTETDALAYADSF